MSDLIRLVDLEVWTQIGVPDEERAQPQRLLITLDLKVMGVERAAQADDVSLTVNYYSVAQRIKRLASERPRKLVETLAEEIATDLLSSYAIERLAVEIKKFVLPETRYVSVRIERPERQRRSLQEGSD